MTKIGESVHHLDKKTLKEALKDYMNLEGHGIVDTLPFKNSPQSIILMSALFNN